LIIAPDAATIATLSAHAQRCGLDIIETFEGLNFPAAGFDFEPDIIIVKVQSGQEMAAYYIGSAAAERSIVTLFATSHSQTPVIEALVNAVPHSVIVEQPCGKAHFAAKIESALNSARRTRT
jgi:AmiR/NasT family two-component response regulator